MNTEIVIALVGILSTVVSSMVTFTLTKKKYNAEVDSKMIENMQHALDFYKTVSEDNNKKLEEYKKECDGLRMQVMDLQAQLIKMSVSLCYNATCTARKLSKEINQKEGKRNGVKSTKKVEKE